MNPIDGPKPKPDATSQVTITAAAIATTTTNAATAAHHVATQTFQQAPPVASPAVLIIPCLKKLVGLLSESEMELLKYLPLEQIIEVSLKKLLSSMMIYFRDLPNDSETVFETISKLENWKRPEGFAALKLAFIEFAKKTEQSTVWRNACADYLPTLELLAKQRQNFGFVIKSPLDPNTKQQLLNFFMDKFTFTCNASLSAACSWYLTKGFNYELYSDIFFGKPADPHFRLKPANIKKEFLRCMERQVAVFFCGSRCSNVKDFLGLIQKDKSKVKEVNHYKVNVCQVTDGLIQLVGDLRNQYHLTEKSLAFMTASEFSEESKLYLEKFFTDLHILYDKFYGDVIAKWKTRELDPAWKSLEHTSSDMIRQKVAEVFRLLAFQTVLGNASVRKRGLGDSPAVEKCFTVTRRSINSQIETLKKEFSNPTVDLIIKFGNEFQEQVEVFGKAVLDLEGQYARVDKLLADTTKSTHVLSSDCFEMMQDKFDQALDNFILGNSLAGSIKTFFSSISHGFEQMRSELKEVMEHKSLLKELKEKRTAITKKAKGEISKTVLVGCTTRRTVERLDYLAATLRFVRDTYLQICSFADTEADTKTQQFNKDERNWMSYFDELEHKEKEETIAKETASSKPKKSKMRKKGKTKAVETTASTSAAHTPKATVVECAYTIDHYSTRSAKLVATHRHNLRRYYQVPEYIVTPLSLVDNPYTPSEIAIQQQIMSTDCIQWVVGMLEGSNNAKVKELLSTFYFWWLHLGAEQGLTGKILSINSENPLKHRIDTLCLEAGLKVTPELLKGHIWGTDYIRYPFTVPQPTQKPPLAFIHVRTPSVETVKAILAANESLMKEFVRIQDSLLTSSTPDSPKSPSSNAEADKKNAQSSSPASASAAKPASQTISNELAKELGAQSAALETAQKTLSGSLATLSSSLSERVLKNVEFHLNNLKTVLDLIMEQPQQENLFVQMSIAYLSTQYLCENLGHYLALGQRADLRRHDLTMYTSLFGLGDYDESIVGEIRKLNLEKGSEYLFRGNHYADVAETIRYLSGLFATSKFVMLTKEGISLPKAAETGLTEMHEEMVQKLKTLVTLVVKLISVHFPNTNL